MVRTTKGPVAPQIDKPKVEKLTAEDKKLERAVDMDDETWERIVSLARSQSISPAEAIRRAIVQVYGAPTPTTGFNSGD